MILKLAKVQPKDIVKSFTKENEQTGILDFLFYLKDGKLKSMNTCEKFTSAYGRKSQMLKQVLPGQLFQKSSTIEVEVVEVTSFYVANRIQDNMEIFFAKRPLDSTLDLVPDYYSFIENLGENAIFFTVK